MPSSRETTRWAAILCFIAALMSVGGAGWALFARGVTNDSFGRLSEYLTPKARAALGAFDALNLVSALLNVVLAVALVVGGILLLRRKLAGRTVVIVVCVVYLLATVISYIVGTVIWDGLVAAMSGVSEVEVSRFGPGLGSVIRGCLFVVLILGLVLAPSTKRWLSGQGQQAQPIGQMPSTVGSVAGPDPSLPPPTRTTATISAVVSLLGGAVFLLALVAGLVEAFDSGGDAPVGVIVAIVCVQLALIAAGLIAGGVLLLRRRFSGAVAIAVSWAVAILAAFGLLAAVLSNEQRRDNAMLHVLSVVVPLVLCGAAAITLALVPSTRRWCATRTVGAATGLDRPPSAGPSDAAATTQQRGSRRTVLIAAASVVAVLMIAGAVAGGLALQRSASDNHTAPSAKVSPTADALPELGPGQSYVPFTGLNSVHAMAFDAAGNVYVLDFRGRPFKVVEWQAESGQQRELPMDLTGARGLGIDAAGTLYVGTQTNVVTFRPGDTLTTDLPSFPKLVAASALAVTADGTVYVAGSRLDSNENTPVLKLEPGASQWTVLPSTGLRQLSDIAVDTAGNVYVPDAINKNVVKLPAGGGAQQVLPFEDLRDPRNVAVAPNGTVYIVDGSSSRMFKLAPGADHAVEITPKGPIAGSLAVDQSGTVYYASSDLVMKLAPQ